MTEVTNATVLKDHLREWMRKPTEDLKDHLSQMGVEGYLPNGKQALVKLHADTHGSAPLTGSEAVGATVKPEPAKAPAAKPATKKAPVAANAPEVLRRKPATKTAPKPAPAKAKAPARKPATPAAKPAPARRTRAAAKPATPAKPATKTAPKPATPATNGSAPANASKHDLAKRLIDLVAAEFADETPENKAKLAYWLHGLPTGYPNGGGGGYLRYWPKGLPRPTTAGWRKPE